MDIQKEREAFEHHLTDTGLVEFAGYGFEVDECDEYLHEPTQVAWDSWLIGLGRSKAQAVPQWISVNDQLPPSDEMVLICWSDSPDIEPEKDFMDICVDTGCPFWANSLNDEQSHWMPLPKPQESAND